MKTLPRYIFKTDLIGNFSTNSKNEFYRFIIAFLDRRINFSVWIKGKEVLPDKVEKKIFPVVERFWLRERAGF